MKRIFFFTSIVLIGLSANVFLSPAFSSDKAAKTEKAEKKEKIEKTYIASAMGHPKDYHRASCKLVGVIKPSNMVIFGTKKNAEQHGYKPCKICKP